MMKNVLTILVVLGAIVAISGTAMAAVVPNGDFETLYKPGTAITGVISTGGWNIGVGPGTPIENGKYEFSDGSTSDDTEGLADVPGWIGYDAQGWIDAGGTYGRDPNRGPGYNQGSMGTGANNHTPGGTMGYGANGSGWGNPAGALITSADSLGTADGSLLILSMWARAVSPNPGGARPVVLDLLANGVALVPAPFTDPELTGDWVQISRTYDADTMAAVIGQDLTIVLGTLRGETVGDQSHFDDVTLIPEPATMALLGLGGLALLRRRRRA